MSLSRAQRRRLDLIARGRSDEGVFLLEGPRAVHDALGAGVVRELWLRSDLAGSVRADLLDAAERAGVAVEEAGAAEFGRLTATVTPQGVLAVVRDTARTLDEVTARPGLLLWLDGLQDPGNAGAVVRVAAAFGAAGLVVSDAGAHPLGLKALRASAGLALQVPFARAPAGAIAAALAAHRVFLLERDGTDVFAVADVPARMVLVIGSEGRGPGPEARACAAGSLGIRIEPGVDSLNAAVAAGIAVAALRHARPGPR